MAVKLHPHATDVAGAISYAFSEFQSLRDDLDEVLGNMEDGFSQTARFETLTETKDALDGFCDEEPEIEVEDVGGLAVSFGENRRKSVPRSGRRDNAVRALEGARDALQAFVDENEFVEDEEDADDEAPDGSFPQAHRDAAEELISALDDAVGSAEGLEFPGMYG